MTSKPNQKHSTVTHTDYNAAERGQVQLDTWKECAHTRELQVHGPHDFDHMFGQQHTHQVTGCACHLLQYT